MRTYHVFVNRYGKIITEPETTNTVVIKAAYVSVAVGPDSGNILQFRDDTERLIAAFYDWVYFVQVPDESPAA